MVAYLKKTEASEGFHQIVDFLNASHIRYALTENPTIYVSLINQFWQTATTSTLDNGEIEIIATIDGKVKIVTKASIRRHLKLEDSDGISTLPTTEIFEQLALMGSKKTAREQFSSNIATAIICLATNRRFNFSKLIFDGMGPVVQGEGSTHLVESHHTHISAPPTLQLPISSPSRRLTRQESVVPQPRSPTQTNVADDAASTSVDVRLGGATTTVTSLEAGQGSGNIDKTPTMPHDSPLPRVHTLRSDEDRMQHNELMDLVTKLSDRVVALETDLQQTKKFYDKLEGKARIVVSDDEEDLEDPSKQGRKIAKIDEDPNISLVQHDVEVQGRHEHDMEPDFEFTTAEEVYTAKKGVSTAEPVSTAGASVSTASASLAKDKGKAIIEEVETIQTKTKLQLEQERLGYKEALRLQSEEREMYFEVEKARLLAELINERKRYFDRTKVKKGGKGPSLLLTETYIVIPELAARRSKEMQKKNLFKKVQRDKRLEKAQNQLKNQRIKKKKNCHRKDTAMHDNRARKYWKIIRVGNHTEVYQFFDDMLKAFDREDLVKLWSLVKEKFTSTEPTEDKEREIWVELKRLFEPDTDDELWKLKKHIHDNLTWKLYDSCGVYHVSTEDGIDIYMLVKKEYPLSRRTLTLMLVVKLLVEQDSEMSRELLRKIFMHVERPRR
ncbi:hypothetical protein Tco_0834253 [Tanacetum coccineum]